MAVGPEMSLNNVFCVFSPSFLVVPSQHRNNNRGRQAMFLFEKRKGAVSTASPSMSIHMLFKLGGFF